MYKIINVEAQEEVVVADVEFTLNDGTVKTAKIQYANPNDGSTIIETIENWEITENRKLEAIEKNAEIIDELKSLVGVEREVPVERYETTSDVTSTEEVLLGDITGTKLSS